MINRFRRMLVLGMAAAAGLAATQALAQSDAQRNAIKSACRSDYMAKCASVPPGGTAAFQCLQKNIASLSSSCQTAVKALEPAAEAKPAAEVKPAAETRPAAEAKPPAETKPAAEAKPASVPSAPAKPAVAEASKPPEPPKAAAQPAAAVAAVPTQSPAAKPAAAASAPAAQPSEAQVAAIRSACGSDYRKVCSSVPPGGAAALQCLEQNKAKLSAPCAQAMASSRGGAAPATAAVAAPAVATTAAPTAPALVLRPLRPLEELRIVRAACGADARALCSGIEPGGGRIAQCLAANAGALTPGCKGMLAEFAANR
ncbi:MULTISPECIES: hypothetical protein [unclassified Bradyrhizobium]|uniref:cysteine rich repeat-containing protein n=1 Tax=unclassified Bradyrhizobium TaxID=2631580 RepID=UPI0029160BCD|nr:MULTISPECIES: hypothetical protein [unclassified Bradyrhizobium]